MADPCEYCPMLKTTPQAHRNLVLNASERIQQHGGFPCHDKHPESHALVDGPYKHTDCIGHAQMSDTVSDMNVDFGDLLWKVVCLTKIIEAKLKERNT